MSKFKKGLTVNRDDEDPMRRPRPVSQEGYYYPEEHVNDKNSLHPNSRRQPIRQYGSSASLEVRHEQNRQQREREFFTTSPSVIPKQAPFEKSQNMPAMQSNFHNANSSIYYQQSVRKTNNQQNLGNIQNLPSHNNINPGEIPRSIPNSNSHNISTHNAHSINLNGNQKSYNSPGFLTPQPYSSNNSRSPSPSLQHRIPPQYQNLNSASQPIRKDSLTDPYVNASPSPNSRGMEQYQTLQAPSGHRDQSQHHHYSSKNQNKSKESSAVDNNKSQRLNLSEPVSIEDYVSQAIKYHENNQLEESTKYLKIAAEKGSAVGKVLYGIALRHGWGCKVNYALAFEQLQQAAEPAINILNSINKTVNMSSFRGDLTLAIYELGVCFRHGWGIPKSKATAAHYFEIAANMGDPDAQNDIALCYYKGEGVKKDMKMAAKYYRMADAQGHGTMGNSWIFKEKYNNDKK